jgi:hypothetical protein
VLATGDVIALYPADVICIILVSCVAPVMPLVIDVTYAPAACFALNVLQSVELRYPLVAAVATGMEMAGVVPPLETIGDVPLTAVTFPLRSAESPLIVPMVSVELTQSVVAEFQRIV